MCRYAALGSFIDMGIPGIAVATVANKGGLYVSPYNCPFPFYQAELPPSISSPAWNTLDFNATGTQPSSLTQPDQDMVHVAVTSLMFYHAAVFAVSMSRHFSVHTGLLLQIPSPSASLTKTAEWLHRTEIVLCSMQ